MTDAVETYTEYRVLIDYHWEDYQVEDKDDLDGTWTSPVTRDLSEIAWRIESMGPHRNGTGYSNHRVERREVVVQVGVWSAAPVPGLPTKEGETP